jgi:hypothetical protein
MTEISKKSKQLIARFLSSDAGAELREHLTSMVPKVHKSPNAHEMQFDAGVSEGWRDVLWHLNQLSTLKGKIEDDMAETDTIERN